MIHNNAEICTATHNNIEVKSWIHNGVEVFVSEQLVFSASYIYFTHPNDSSEKVLPLAIDGTPFVDTSYISEFDSCAHINSLEGRYVSVEKQITIGQLTTKALQKFDYAKVYYDCGTFISTPEYYTPLFGYCEIADRSKVAYVEDEGYLSESGFVIVPTSSLSSTIVKACYQIYGNTDEIDVGIAITKIVLTNEKPPKE